MLAWHSHGSSCPFCLCPPLLQLTIPALACAQHHSVPWGNPEETQDSASILDDLKGTWNAHTLVLSVCDTLHLTYRGNQGPSAKCLETL